MLASSERASLLQLRFNPHRTTARPKLHMHIPDQLYGQFASVAAYLLANLTFRVERAALVLVVQESGAQVGVRYLEAANTTGCIKPLNHNAKCCVYLLCGPMYAYGLLPHSWAISCVTHACRDTARAGCITQAPEEMVVAARETVLAT